MQHFINIPFYGICGRTLQWIVFFSARIWMGHVSLQVNAPTKAVLPLAIVRQGKMRNIYRRKCSNNSTLFIWLFLLYVCIKEENSITHLAAILYIYLVHLSFLSWKLDIWFFLDLEFVVCFLSVVPLEEQSIKTALTFKTQVQ